MANKISQYALWGSTFTVASASWTPGDFAGFTFIDALTNQRLIVGNDTDTLYFLDVGTPQVGVVRTFGSPGWTPGQWANGQTVGGVRGVSSLLVDDNGAKFVIAQSTADSLVLADGSDPTLVSGAAYILFGGSRAVTVGASTDDFNGYWQIVGPDGSAATDSDTDDGAVTVVAGGTTLPAGQAAYSQVIDLEGIESFSIVAGFLADGASSPVGALSVLVNNNPGPDVGAQPGGQSGGPSPLDPGWAPIKTSKDGAASAATVAIADTAAHVIVPSAHPNSPILFARWLMLQWVPTSGSGNLSAAIFGYGARG